MTGNVETLLEEVETATAEMTAGKDLPLEAIGEIVARRGALIERLARSEGLDASAVGRVKALIGAGIEVGSHLARRRASLSLDLDALEQAGRWASGLASVVPAPSPSLNTQA
jgi:hypothetical protein